MCRLENWGCGKGSLGNMIVLECDRRLSSLCEYQIRASVLLSSMKANIPIPLYILQLPMTAFVGGKANGLGPPHPHIHVTHR